MGSIESKNIMRVLLISANREDINMPTLPMGLGCVAAAAQRAGHEAPVLAAASRQPVDRLHALCDALRAVVGLDGDNEIQEIRSVETDRRAPIHR